MKRKVMCIRGAIRMLSFAVVACGVSVIASADALEFALKLTDEATPADAGLPKYPGSKPYKEADQTTSAANVGISVPQFGFKIVAMNLESRHTPQRIATFYRRALSKYGRVVECTDDDKKGKSNRGAERNDELVCDSNDPGDNSVVYKVGTESDQRIVAIKPHEGGTRFSLVRIDVRD